MKQMFGALALLAGALAGAGPALAQSAPAAGPPKPPEGVSQGVNGMFKVIQVTTVDIRAFNAAWRNRGDQAMLPAHGRTRRNQPITAHIIFNGCKVDARGNCNIYTDFEIYDPDGEVYFRRSAIPQWLGPPDPDGKVMLGGSGLGLTVENGEKLGTYRLRTFTIDKVANVSVSNEVPVNVVEAK